MHIGLLSHFTPGMHYQDNLITEYNCKDGYEVLYLTDTRRYVNGMLVEGPEESVKLENGLQLIRVKFDLNNRLKPIKKSRKVKDIIEEYNPDTILVHGLVGYELLTVSKYIKRHQTTLFYVDSHQSLQNYANNPIEGLLFTFINRYFVRKALPSINKILYIGLEEKEFLVKKYGITEEKMEFFPLGGKIYPTDEQIKQREHLITELGLPEDVIILGHSGKMDAVKKTEILLEGFEKLQDERFHLIIFGRIPEDRKDVLEPMIKRNKRIHFLGWKVGQEIDNLLLGIDLYCQPNDVTSTVQSALCCGCAMMLYPFKTYKYLLNDQCFWVQNSEDIYGFLQQISDNPKILYEMKKKDYEIATRKLDYSILSRRIYK